MTRPRQHRRMIALEFQDWRSRVILTRDLDVPADRAEFFARARRGEFFRLFRGVYVRSSDWAARDPRARYELRVQASAVAMAPEEPVFSHESAAILWRLPLVGEWPVRAHVIEAHAAGGRGNAMFQRHTSGVPAELRRIQGLQVTALPRTVVDLARMRPFTSAVVIADAALRRTMHPVEGLPASGMTREDLLAELADAPLRHGTAKAAKVIHFADGAADRPGESMSRCSMRAARLPMPELQVKLRGSSGRTYFADFLWRSDDLIGEFDGASKYTDPEFLRGRTPEIALMDEKRREDDLRAAGFRFSRWGWDVAISPARLRAHLLAAGLGR